MQATYAVVFVLLGLLVLVSYAMFYPFDDRAIWAGLRDRRAFAVWCLTGSTSVVAFLAFSYELLNATTDGACIYPYTAFLSSAALYMPFASNMYFMATILLLAVTAVSAWLMVYCSAMLFGWNYCTWLLVVLAVHCTVVDLIFWGYTWWNQPIQAECSYEQVIAVAVEFIALLLLCAGTASAMSYYEILGLGRNVSMANLELALQNKRSIYKPDDHWTLQENKDAWLFYTCAALNVAVTHKLIDQYTYKRKHREWTCAATNVTFGVMKPVVANLTNHTRFVAAEIPAWRLATLNINVPPMNMTIVVPVAQVVQITQTADAYHSTEQSMLTTVVEVGCVIVFGIIEIYMLAILVHIFGVSGLFIDCALHVAFVAFQLHSCYVSKQCTWVEWE